MARPCQKNQIVSHLMLRSFFMSQSVWMKELDLRKSISENYNICNMYTHIFQVPNHCKVIVFACLIIGQNGARTIPHRPHRENQHWCSWFHVTNLCNEEICSTLHVPAQLQGPRCGQPQQEEQEEQEVEEGGEEEELQQHNNNDDKEKEHHCYAQENTDWYGLLPIDLGCKKTLFRQVLAFILPNGLGMVRRTSGGPPPSQTALEWFAFHRNLATSPDLCS